MKRTFLLLMLIFTGLYGRLGYELFVGGDYQTSLSTGALSDIAQAVTAIPLQPAGGQPIGTIKSLRQEGDNLFLVSNQTLYRFRRSGEFVCRITEPDKIRVAEYVVDTAAQRLIVLGNEDDIHYYSFTGELLSENKLEGDSTFRQIRAITLHDNCIWTTEENLRFDPQTKQLCMEKRAVKYDTSFQQVETHRLQAVELSSRPFCSSFFHLELAFAEGTGNVYAYSPADNAANLLQDTLLIRRRQQMSWLSYADAVPVYPLRFGRRYWLSSYDNPADPSQNYTFCFDSDTGRSWHVKGGFTDDFYRTGSVSNLQAMDAYSNTYYYCQSGDNPVVYIVQLKG